MQRFTDVAVVEATQFVSSGEHRLEQTHIVFAGRVEARIAATLMSFRLCQIGDLLIGRRRIIHNGQRIQVAVVGDAANSP